MNLFEAPRFCAVNGSNQGAYEMYDSHADGGIIAIEADIY